MKGIKASILTVSLLAFAGTAGAIDLNAICCDGGFEYRHPSAFEKEQQRLKDELAAAQKQLADREREMASLRSSSSESIRSAKAELDRSKARTAELEGQLADRDREMASLRSSAGESSRLASQLPTVQAERDRLAAELAASQASLAADLAAAKQRNAELEGQLAAAQSSGATDKDKLAADLATAKQRNAELEAQLAAAQSSGATDRDKLAAELAASNQRVADSEKQLADRDRQLAALRGDLSAEMAKLNEAQRGLVRALRPEIEQGNITVDLNNERLLINLTSSMLFGSGEDQLKPAGVDALKRVGAILKDYPEYAVEVDGHTDNRPIRSSLKKRFPTNKELSDARAATGITALAEGGVSPGTITSAGYADTRPVAPNTTDEGRQKNRRVEVRVTPKS
jgi:chemotaxis protein MotB